MIAAAGLRLVNRLLGAERWASARLAPFAGQVARIEYRNWSVAVVVDAAGLLTEAANDAIPLVTLRLPDDAPARLLGDRESLFGAARISGSAEFAEALAFVARNLRWDIEDDLAQLLGASPFADIAARRLLAAGRQFGAWQRDAAQRGARNLSEYLLFERPTISTREDLRAFCSDVDQLRDDCARLEKRLQRIELTRSLRR
ncbi:ubiquinone biosynthesis accessory factor UbiJ [Rhodocyclus tenuis]|uniref:ubiquinone biosynthesis accessory factor UbiJ n=1 Tax=Rhodocyclus tenuis TaxID=1066 RepID=UPI001906D320|nr:hypothetical protein [Rhodocyclus tenuis]MBK1681488.1 hypothetical protein [Rhodocyclus tenuis]